MAKEKETTEGYKAVSVTETVRPAIIDEKGEEVSTHEAIVTIMNDVKELKRKLVG